MLFEGRVKNRFWIVVLAILLVFVKTQHLHAQSTSNRGTDFWLAYAAHVDGLTSRMTLFISSDVNTTYHVTSGNTTIASGNVVANVVTAVFIDPNVYNVYIASSDVREINRGINVTTGEPVSLYAVISNNARTGSSLILPTATLEQEYYVFSQQHTGNFENNQYSEFTIVGAKDGTVVEINPNQPSRNGTKSAKVPFQITLNKGDVYQYQAVDDLSGTHVKAITGCTPIAVFSGNTRAAFCEPGNTRNPNGGDNIFQQLFPVTAWGKNFVSAPFYNTLNGNTDLIKIIVAEDNTMLTINGSTTSVNGVPLNNPYSRGSIISFPSITPNVIKSTSPIAVAQYQTSQTCNLSNAPVASQRGPYLGDPEMTILNPIEQTLKDITVYSKLNSVPGVNTNIEKYFLNIIIKTVDIPSFTLDGASISSQFKPIADGEYSYAVVDVTNSSDQHRLVAAGGFVAIAYGYGYVESYAYLAGTDLRNLKSNIQVYESGSTIAASNFCLGADFDFILRLPYITDKITWNLNDGAKIEVVNSPPYTTEVEDGIQYYFYRYSLASSYFPLSGNYALKALIQKPADAICATDEEIITSFDVFFPSFSLPTEVCINTSVQFTDTSPKNGGSISSWLWDFGDGTTSTEQNPQHVFISPGTKTVNLKVVTDIGCSLLVSQTIEVMDNPKPDFATIGSTCVNSSIQFNNQSTFVNSNIVGQIWDFGNGTTSTESSPTVIYNTVGTYTVRLTTTSSIGCSATIEKEVVVYDKPEVSFDDPGSCIDDRVVLEAKVIKGNVVSWLWDFGDGTNDVSQNTKQNPEHVYSQTGNYQVTLTAVSAEGCSTIYTRNITISGSNPQAVFEVKTASNICANTPVLFENKSTVEFGNITKIEWIFDYKEGGVNVGVTDNEPALGKIYTHTYPNASTKVDYQVVMRAYSGQLCYEETSPITVSVYPAPIIKFDAIDPVCEDSGPFQLLATEENGVPGSYIFSGMGVSAAGLFNPAISGPGNFNVTYTYTSNMGCIEEKNINVTINKLPTLTMPSEIDILAGGQKQIEATALGAGLTYKWTPSEGLSSDKVLNPIANPEKTTRYTLTISSSSCEIVSDILVKVHENPIIPNVFSPNGDGKNDTWVIKYLETFTHGHITIFNRYGQKVFYAAPYNTPWDGKRNGIDMPIGVYYYIIEPNNGKKKHTGSVTILR